MKNRHNIETESYYEDSSNCLLSEQQLDALEFDTSVYFDNIDFIEAQIKSDLRSTKEKE